MKERLALDYQGIESNLYRVSLSNHILEEVGSIEYIGLINKGPLEVGQAVVSIEADKASIELAIDFAGEILEVNDAVFSDPSLLTTSSDNHSWLFIFKRY